MGTALAPLAPRVASLTIQEVVALDGVLIVAVAIEVTQAMAGKEMKKFEDFEVAVATANSVLLRTLEAKDIMATMMLVSSRT